MSRQERKEEALRLVSELESMRWQAEDVGINIEKYQVKSVTQRRLRKRLASAYVIAMVVITLVTTLWCPPASNESLLMAHTVIKIFARMIYTIVNGIALIVSAIIEARTQQRTGMTEIGCSERDIAFLREKVAKYRRKIEKRHEKIEKRERRAKEAVDEKSKISELEFIIVNELNGEIEYFDDDKHHWAEITIGDYIYTFSLKEGAYEDVRRLVAKKRGLNRLIDEVEAEVASRRSSCL